MARRKVRKMIYAKRKKPTIRDYDIFLIRKFHKGVKQLGLTSEALFRASDSLNKGVVSVWEFTEFL